MKPFKIRCSAISKILPPNEKDTELSKGVQSYLIEWYANEIGQDYEDLQTKYTIKGNLCESEHIFFIGEKLGVFGIEKNTNMYVNEYIHGTPDVVERGYIIDVKCSWNYKTFTSAVVSKRNYDYWCQLQGYMALTGKPMACLSYALLDTPEKSNYGKYVSYVHIPFERRNFQDWFDFDKDFVKRIENKVIQCREFLENYELQLNKKLGL